MLSNLPPGVSSYDIDRQAGAIPCKTCGHMLHDHEFVDEEAYEFVCHGGESCACGYPDEYGGEPEDDYPYDTREEYEDVRS